MFSRSLQLFCVICLIFKFSKSMSETVRAVTEMNIISVISCAYLNQLGYSCLKNKHKSVMIILSCLFCCWYVFVIWLSLNSKSVHTNYRKSQNLSLSVERSWNSYNAAVSKTSKYKDDVYQQHFEFSRISRQHYWVLPFSLERYVKELENNRGTSELMRYEWARYETLKAFPFDSPVMPIRLASNGFYYNGSGDSVTCFSCGLVYHGWKEGDSVTDIHANRSPNCHLLIGADETNIGIHTVEVQGATGGGGRETDDSFRSEEVYARRHSSQSAANGVSTSPQARHKYPDYERYDYRMDTFTEWPCRDILEPQILALAGFFYAGFSDCVRCFSCGGGLRNWEYGDGPWEEHARWFPGCVFLREQKGLEFIRQHREVQTDSDDEQESTSTAIVSGAEALDTVKRNREESEKASLKNTSSAVNTSDGKSKMTAGALSTDASIAIKSLEQTLLPMGFSVADIHKSLETIGIEDITESAITRVLDDLLEQSQVHDKEQQHGLSDNSVSTLDPKHLQHNTDATVADAAVQGAIDTSNEQADPKVLQEENSRLIDQLTCKICMDKESNVVFIPCGHMVSCETCAPHIRKCAICRQPIKGRVKAFMS